MVAVAVAAILAAIAFPSYRAYVLRANRAYVRAVLVDIAARMEAEALNARAYPDRIGFYIGTGDAAIAIDRNGRVVGEADAPADAPAIYRLELAPVGAQVEVRAEAVGAQVDDAQCRVLILSTSGLRSATPGNRSECWNR